MEVLVKRVKQTCSRLMLLLMERTLFEGLIARSVALFIANYRILKSHLRYSSFSDCSVWLEI